MRNKICLILFLSFILINIEINANDSVFSSGGATLSPVKETSIQLKKEVLKLIPDKKNGGIHVQVYFEFFNPDEEKNLTVGFIAPPAYSPDDVDSTDRHPDISNFTVLINNTTIDYKITMLEQSSFQFLKQKFGGGDYVYYFNANFKKGLNIIEHEYNYYGGIGNMMDEFFPYILMSGNLWANSKIDDFTLIIHADSSSYMRVNNLSDKCKKCWQLLGEGKMISSDHGANIVFYNEGIIYYHENDFKPKSDLLLEYFHQLNRAVLDELAILAFFGFDDFVKRELDKLSKADLYIVRNAIYAKYGYKFKNPDILNYFDKKIWYRPLYNSVETYLTEDDIKKIQHIINLEKQK